MEGMKKTNYQIGLKELARRAGVSYADAAAVFLRLAEELIDGNEVQIRQFGTFHVGQMPRKSAPSLVNPGEMTFTPPFKRLYFRSAAAIREGLNE